MTIDRSFPGRMYEGFAVCFFNMTCLQLWVIEPNEGVACVSFRTTLPIMHLIIYVRVTETRRLQFRQEKKYGDKRVTDWAVKSDFCVHIRGEK